MRKWNVLPSVVVLVAVVACADQPTTVLPNRMEALRSTGSELSCGQRVNATAVLLMECVTLAGVRTHQAALQAIADANGSTRVSGTAGYDESVDYVVSQLQAAGYSVTRQPVQFQTFISLTPPLLEQVAPPPAGSLTTQVLAYSGSGDVTASVANVSNLGCNAADFAGFPAGNIALILRGTCNFSVKAANAYNAGAAAVVIYNNGATSSLNWTLGSQFTLGLPVVGTTLAVGQQLANTPGLVMRVKTETFRGTATAENVLAESRTGNPDNVVMVGAHLDAVNAGPGINDNGSGVGALLETAVHMARVNLANTVRFAFWAADEAGLAGSTHYVNSLPAADLARIALYLNFDVIGSPNYVNFVYDGDDSDGIGLGAGPAGSDEIESALASYYSAIGQATKGYDLNGFSGYAPFMTAGIPVGGIFSGATDVKTAEDASIWGGTAGIAYDPCYHEACDTYANVSNAALDVNSDAVAWATHTFAMSTERVNGIKGRGNGKARGIFKPSGAAVAPHAHAAQDR